jgi:hypothetical protein
MKALNKSRIITGDLMVERVARRTAGPKFFVARGIDLQVTHLTVLESIIPCKR